MSKKTILFKRLNPMDDNFRIDMVEVPKKNRNMITVQSSIINYKKKGIEKITLFDSAEQGFNKEKFIKMYPSYADKIDVIQCNIVDVISTINDMPVTEGLHVIIVDIPDLFSVPDGREGAIGAFFRLVNKQVVKINGQMVGMIY